MQDIAGVLAEFADVIRLQTETMGMKAENKQREMNGESLAYTEKDFLYVAAEIETKANNMRNF
jgi:hypothetical protein